jgi:hypothetical protein
MTDRAWFTVADLRSQAGTEAFRAARWLLGPWGL